MKIRPSERAQGGAFPARAIVFEQPRQLALRSFSLPPPAEGEILVDVEWSGISTGTEKLLWTGRMPDFPGLGYPLVPGYETVGTVVARGRDATLREGDRVFVPGARCFGDVRGLFGGAASHLVVEEARVMPLSSGLREEAVLLALAATAYHALHRDEEPALPDLIVGHGVLGRLLARLTLALGGPAPVVWENDSRRCSGGNGYEVTLPDADDRRDYGRVLDASGAEGMLDELIQRTGKGGEIVLAGFYQEPVSFVFPPAFMRETTIRIAAEWTPRDLDAVSRLAESGDLSLAGLVSHRADPAQAEDAYIRAFGDPACLKMILDWRTF